MSSSYQARGYGPRVSLRPKIHPRQAQPRVPEERAPAYEPAAAQTGPQRDNSLLGRWWWSVDRWTLTAIFILIGFGYVMMLAASPAVAERIGTSRDMFILKQVAFLALATVVVILVSLLSPRSIKRLAIAGCLIALVLTAATLFVGVEIKGARRW